METTEKPMVTVLICTDQHVHVWPRQLLLVDAQSCGLMPMEDLKIPPL